MEIGRGTMYASFGGPLMVGVEVHPMLVTAFECVADVEWNTEARPVTTALSNKIPWQGSGSDRQGGASLFWGTVL